MQEYWQTMSTMAIEQKVYKTKIQHYLHLIKDLSFIIEKYYILIIHNM